jgi:hypothetical protein
VAVLLVVALAMVLAKAGLGLFPPSAAPPVSSRAGASLPISLPGERLALEEMHDEFGVAFVPPAADARPVVGPDCAVALGWLTGVVPSANTATPVLAILDPLQPSLPDRLIWLVRLNGACLVSHGLVVNTGPCPLGEMDVLLDAGTGEFLGAMHDSELADPSE